MAAVRPIVLFLACTAALGTPLSVAIAQPIDVKTVVAEATVAENRRCHDYMTVHPDVAGDYGRVSVDTYCDCEANLLVGSVAPDALVRMMVDRDFEAKLGQRRRDTGLYCLDLLMKRLAR